jgi:methionyl-tRNA formyltransferase
MKLTASAVKAMALQRGLPVAQPPTLRDAAAQAALAELAPDAMVVAAYGLLLPPAVLAIPRLGCLNIHASLLPRWRGAAPVQRALLAGDAESGISIMQMDAGLDTGPVWSRRTLSIGAAETSGSLLERLTTLGACMIVESLATLEQAGAAQPQPQPVDGVTYAHKIDKRDAAIDFSRPAIEIDRQVRAFDPVPGAFCESGGVLLKVWKAVPDEAPVPAGAVPGTLLAVEADSLRVACGSGSLRLLEVQRAGGRRQPAVAHAQAADLGPGARFGAGLSVLAPAAAGAATAPASPG